MTIDQSAVTAPPEGAGPPAAPSTGVVETPASPPEGSPQGPSEAEPDYTGADPKLRAENITLRQRARAAEQVFVGVPDQAREAVGELLNRVRSSDAVGTVEYLLDLAQATAGDRFADFLARRGGAPGLPGRPPVAGQEPQRSPLAPDDKPLTRADFLALQAEMQAQADTQAQLVEVNADLIRSGVQPGTPQARAVLSHMLTALESEGRNLSAAEALNELRSMLGGGGGQPLANTVAPNGSPPAPQFEGTPAERARARLEAQFRKFEG